MGVKPFGIISCGRSKLSHPAAARDIYTSGRFKMLRDTMERIPIPYLILSAKHGFLKPGTIISPYDTSWDSPDHITVETLKDQIDLIPAGRLVIVAVMSYDYRDRIIEALQDRDDLTINTDFCGNFSKYGKLKRWTPTGKQ